VKYNELNVHSHRKPKRVGRGIAGGQGKTAGRGTKGQGARAGSSRRPGFAGGQNPLMQRLPKLPGFRSLRVKSEIVYTDQLESLKEKNITNKLLAEKGLTTSEFVVVKLLHRGDLTKSVNLSIQGASLGAMESVQKAGGSVDLVSRIGRPQKDNQRSAKA